MTEFFREPIVLVLVGLAILLGAGVANNYIDAREKQGRNATVNRIIDTVNEGMRQWTQK